MSNVDMAEPSIHVSAGSRLNPAGSGGGHNGIGKGGSSSTSKRLRRSRPRESASVWVILAGVVVVLVLVLGIPVVKLVVAAFSPAGRSAMAGAFANHGETFWHSIVLGLLVGVCGTFIGFVCAYVQTFVNIPGKHVLHWLTLLPTISPPFAAATAIITLFGKRGMITNGLFGWEVNIYGLPGLVMVLTMTFTPVAYLNIKGMFENLDPATFEAASSLGATEFKTLFKVTVPMVLPAMLSSFLVLFVEGIADLANPLVIGGDYRVLASQIYFAVAGSGDISGATGVALVLLVPALTVFFIQKYWANKHSVVTVTGKPTGSLKPVKALNVIIPMVFIAAMWLLLVLMVYLSLFIGGFVKILGVDNSFTWDHFTFVQRLGSSAIGTTLMLTLIAAPIAAVLALAIGWLVVRHLPHLGKVLDLWGMLGVAVPGTVLGLGFALAYSQSTVIGDYEILPPLAGGLAVGGGAIAIIMVFIARGDPTGQQAFISALQQINPQVEEAATSLGAGPLTVVRKVTLPLMSSALVTSITYAITKSMTTITAIIFITTPQTKVMTSQILDEVDAGRFGNAFAYSSLLIILVLIVLGLSNILLGQLNHSKKA
ncbi:ABC transporter permease [Bifidobacterium mongoliense]|uniref:Iron(III) transport system permease protein n=1 Tax=Bifidobacterium mongoliense DSM 21395 TaxID=1437603 RepID=A0A087BVJ7_9BIFI|nr:iron ABC transporter permease [Bifidobacterium mongoliense]KFI75047.1 iron(III) transport system permease protein [Bifidobacterium mongoliense DSM 21395]